MLSKENEEMKKNEESKMKQIPLNTDIDGCVTTILAGYYKFGTQTLLLGNYGTTGGAIKVEYE